MKKKNVLNSKITAIMGAALAAISGIGNNVHAADNASGMVSDNNSIEFNAQKKKPMPVLKLNLQNLADSKFVANHNSHASHRSHYSHYSHRSGAMFN